MTTPVFPGLEPGEGIVEEEEELVELVVLILRSLMNALNVFEGTGVGADELVACLG